MEAQAAPTSLELQQDFADRIPACTELGTEQQESSRRLDELYHSLAQRAFSGELFEKSEADQVAEVLDLQPTLFD